MSIPSNVFIFGDSITSTFQSPTFGSGTYATTIAYGYPWSQRICNALGIPYTYRLSQSVPPFGPGYAVAGAGWLVNGTPGAGTSLAGQISQFLTDYSSVVPANALITIWSATNDILNASVTNTSAMQTYLTNAASQAQSSINSLVSAGATRIILFDCYPTEYLYASASTGIGSATYLAYQAAGVYFNNLMHQIASATPQVQLFPVRQVYLNRVNGAKNYPSPTAIITDFWDNNLTTNPVNYLTHDGKHPTDSLHLYIAQQVWPYILNKVPAPIYVPRRISGLLRAPAL